MRIVPQTLRDHWLFTKSKKCDFWLEQVAYIGHMVSSEGISAHPSKVEAIVEWKRPTKVTEVWSILGMVGYYQKIVQDFSKIATPLTQLTRKGVKFEWNEIVNEVFENWKKS